MVITTVVLMPYTEMNKVLSTGMPLSLNGRKILRKRNTKDPKSTEMRRRAVTDRGKRNGPLSQETMKRKGLFSRLLAVRMRPGNLLF